jgi:hypothetical protein
MDLEIADFAPAEERVWNYEIEGSVAVAGHVYDEETGEPLTGLRVYARKSTDNLASGMRVDAPVNSDGAYELKLTRGPGEYHVFPAYSPHFKQARTQPNSAIVQVEAGQTVEANLMYHSAFTRTFRVVDEAGNPVGATSQIYNALSGMRRGSQASWETGEFIYAGFPSGVDTWVAFTYRAQKFASTESSHYVGKPGEVVPEETIILKSDSTIQGTIIDPSGAPYVGEVTLVLKHQDGKPKHERILPDAEGLIVVREPGLRYEYGAEETVFTVEFVTMADFGDDEQLYNWRSEPITCMPGYDVDLGTMQLSLREADPVTAPES